MAHPFRLFLLAASLLALSACGEYTSDVDDPINLIPGEDLTSGSQLGFLTAGLQGSFAETHDIATTQADGLSDAQVFDRDLPQATFPSYDRLERGAINIDDGTINDELGQLRFYADDLVARVEELGSVEEQYREDQRAALFYGNFLGGVARAWYASYLGLNAGEGGGGVIDNGPFIPAAEMYDLALENMEASLEYATDYQAKVVYSTMARVHLYSEEYGEALADAQQGLEEGDDPFVSEHSVESTNEWFFFAGEGRVQFRTNERFPGYVDENPAEEARLPLVPIEGRSGTEWSRQNKYPERASSIVFVDWQETALMIAELGLRGEGGVDALDQVNAVRASHDLAPLEDISLQGSEGSDILTERDKELFGRGQRLVDQRRFGIWHLGDSSEDGPWRYFPVSQSERNNNPNF